MDGVTGQVLFERNPHERLPMASTTKLMTALVATENGNLNTVVTVATHSAMVGGSSMYLEAGEKLTLEQLLYGLLMVSGNDAADAIATDVGGTVDHFVDMMNARARSLHLADTHYATPHGLPHPDHYSSAYDLAVIARAAFANPEVAKIAHTRTKVLPGNDRIARRFFVNHNKLLGKFPGAWDGKTGYTVLAGRCFVGSAKRDGKYVIEALLHSPKLWHDAAKLLNYGLDNFHDAQLAAPNTVEGQVAVTHGQSSTVSALLPGAVTVTLANDESPTDYSTRLVPVPGLTAPIALGQTVARLDVLKDGQVYESRPLIAGATVPKALPLAQRLFSIAGWFLSGGFLSLGLFSLLRLRQMRARARYRARRARAAAASRQPSLV